MSAYKHRFAAGKVYGRDIFQFRRFEAWLAQGRRCYFCYEPLLRSQVTGDHKHPRIRGGRHDRDNILAACYDCNSAKGDMEFGAFLELISGPRPPRDPRLAFIWVRRRIWLRQEQAERRILGSVGLTRMPA